MALNRAPKSQESGECSVCHGWVGLQRKTKNIRKHKFFQGVYCAGSDRPPVDQRPPCPVNFRMKPQGWTRFVMGKCTLRDGHEDVHHAEFYWNDVSVFDPRPADNATSVT